MFKKTINLKFSNDPFLKTRLFLGIYLDIYIYIYEENIYLLTYLALQK